MAKRATQPKPAPAPEDPTRIPFNPPPEENLDAVAPDEREPDPQDEAVVHAEERQERRRSAARNGRPAPNPYAAMDDRVAALRAGQPATEPDPQSLGADDNPDELGQPEEEEGEEAAPQPAAPAPAAPGAALVAEALKVGLTETEIAEFKTATDLQREIWRLDRVIGRMGLRERGFGQVPAAQGSTPSAPPAPERREPPAPVPVLDPEFKIALDEKEYDPELLKTLCGMQTHYESRIKRLEAALGEVGTYINSSSTQQDIERVEDYVSGLGEDWVPIFGTGGPLEQIPGTPTHASWKGLLDEIDVLRESYRRTGRRAPKIAVLADRARRTLFEKHEQDIGQRHSAEVQRQRNKLVVGRPNGQRPAAPATGRAAAVANINRKLRQFGMA